MSDKLEEKRDPSGLHFHDRPPSRRIRLLGSFGRVLAQFFQKPQQRQPFVF